MDAFTVLIIAVLGLCVVMHLFGHGHGHASQGEKREGVRRTVADERADAASEPAATVHRHGRGGCH